MGAWGYGLFDDDQASDLREDWKRLYGAYEPAQATEELLGTWRDSLEDPDIGPELWLVLAVLKHRYGCLDDALRDKALAIIDSGSGLTLWEEQGPKEVASRRKTYAKIRAELLSAQPAPRKVKRTPLEPPPFKPGDLICYTFLTGERVLLWVRRYHRDRGEQLPELIPLNWHGTELPPADQIRKLQPTHLKSSLKMMEFNRQFVEKMKRSNEPLPAEEVEVVEHGRKTMCSRFCLREFGAPFVPRERISTVAGRWEWRIDGEPYWGPISRWFEFEAGFYDDLGLRPPSRWPVPAIQLRTDLDRLQPSDDRPVAPDDPPDGPRRPRGADHDYALSFLGRFRTPPQPGDLLALHVRTRGWVFTRIIRTDAGCVYGPSLLLYVYKEVVQSGDPVPALSPSRLLIPPLIVGCSTPGAGYARVVERRPLLPQDVLPSHCFENCARGDFCDELGRPLKRRSEPCGSDGIGGIGLLDVEVAQALGIPVEYS